MLSWLLLLLCVLLRLDEFLLGGLGFLVLGEAHFMLDCLSNWLSCAFFERVGGLLF